MPFFAKRLNCSRSESKISKLSTIKANLALVDRLEALRGELELMRLAQVKTLK